MKKYRNLRKFILTAAGLMSIGQVAHSQVFDPSSQFTDELVLGFRKVGSHQANNEVVVDIGPGTSYTTLSIGSTISVPNYSYSQLTNSFQDLTFLNWSVCGVTDGSISGYPANTLWVTVPRPSYNTQSAAPQRLGHTAQSLAGDNIESIFYGAQALSSQTSSNSLSNTQYLVREPINDPHDLTTFISDSAQPTNSDLGGNWTQNIENITPSPFSGPIRSDFYEVRPVNFTDPHTGQTSGNAYYLGYFTFNTDGTMTFTRAASYIAPAAPTLRIVRNGTTNLISFATTNTATYTLHYTNTAGLTQPVTAWPTVATNITGNGLVDTFVNVTTDSNRVYSVSAH